ncbi:hypothetical protein HMPREF9988_02787 [Staphylococcus epidermidis NIHLM053]|nr:hypothetical protein HMPREF9988_02787 [Staphylococcus epidermidis NIHLM053]
MASPFLYIQQDAITVFSEGPYALTYISQCLEICYTNAGVLVAPPVITLGM